MQGIFTQEELERYSLKFLCGLYKTTSGNLNHGAKSIDIFFKAVSTEAYERPSFGYQAANEIVNDLIQKGLIESQNIEQEIKLTSKGLDKCREDCK
jgi:hypothetical protein